MLEYQWISIEKHSAIIVRFQGYVTREHSLKLRSHHLVQGAATNSLMDSTHIQFNLIVPIIFFDKNLEFPLLLF